MKRKRKRRQSGKIPPKPSKLLSQRTQKNKRNFWLWTHKAIAAFYGLIGLGASFVTFYMLAPRISVYQTGLLVPENALSTQFEVYNSGYLDAKDLRAGCAVIDSQIENAHLEFKDFAVHNMDVAIPLLQGGKKSRFPMALNSITRTERSPGRSSADIVVDVSYRIKILPFLGVFQYSQRFVSTTNSSGNVFWNTAP